jgi:hypothetical protein
MAENDNLSASVRDARSYLSTGGLGEVLGFTSNAFHAGQPKVQSDTDMALALCLMASDCLDATQYAERLAVALHARLFPEVTNWRPSGTLVGLLTQIDNMTAPAAA